MDILLEFTTPSDNQAKQATLTGAQPSFDVSGLAITRLHVRRGEIQDFQRSGDDLVLYLDSGGTVVLVDFFEEDEEAARPELHLLDDDSDCFVHLGFADDLPGVLNEIVLDEACSNAGFAGFGGLGGLTAPLLLGLGAAGAAGAAILLSDDDDGGAAPPARIPEAPKLVEVAPDSGLPGDGVTNDNMPTIMGTSSEPDGTVITLYLDGEVVGYGTVVDGRWSVELRELLADGTHSFTATQETSSGEVSTPSEPFDVVIDTNGGGANPLPSTPPTVDAFADDTGTVGDGITSDATLFFSGTGEPGSIVTVYIDGTAIGEIAVAADGSWRLDHTDTVLADDTYLITATQKDIAGNPASDHSAPLEVTVDTNGGGTDPRPSAPPTVDGFADDNGVPGDGITNDPTLIFSGTGEPGNTIELFIDGEPVGTQTVQEDGSWSFDHSAVVLPDGTYTITATQTDPAGNPASEPSAPLEVTVDTNGGGETPLPVAPPTVESFETDSGIIGDGITNDATLVFAGTAKPGSTVTVFLDALEIGTALADAQGNWTLDHSQTVLPDGTYSITATQQDVAGNPPSQASAPLQVTVDTNGGGETPLPSAPPTVDSFADDSGIVGDGITNDATLVFTGTGEAGSTVTVHVDGEPIGTATVGADGTWSLDHSQTVLPDGAHVITATQEDAAGNPPSAPSAPLKLAIDTNGGGATPAPSAPPTVDSFAMDSGVIGDGITNDATLVFAGSAKPGATVTLFIDDVEIGTALADANGDWTLDHTAVILPDGLHSVTATQQDVAGNPPSEASAPLDVTVDTNGGGDTPQPSAPPTVDSFADDSGIVGDGLTNDATLIFGGTAEPGATVTVFVDGVEVGTTMADADGDWSFDHTATVLPDGDHSITAIQGDAAGNPASAPSAPLDLTIDTNGGGATPQPSAPPTVDSFADDTGVVGDGITNDATLVFSGTGKAGSVVTVHIDGQPIGTTTVGTDGSWSFDNSAQVLPDGDYVVTATQQDMAGNPPSAASNPMSVTVDTNGGGATPAPSAPPTVDTFADDSGVEGDGITNDATLMFSGTAEAGAIVTVSIDGVEAGSVVADVNGTWTFDHTGTILGDGEHQVTATQQDVAGNPPSAPSLPLDVTVDTNGGGLTPLPSQPPTVDSFADDTGVVGDGVTSDNTLIFSGTAEPGATVTVYTGVDIIGTCTADANGNWTLDHSATVLPDGTYVVTATQQDVAGNPVSPPSLPLTVTVDSMIDPPTIDSFADDTGADANDGITNDASPTISGTGEEGATVEITLDDGAGGTVTGTATVTGGSWTFTPPADLADGTWTATAVQTDIAGNVSGPSNSLPVTVDTTIVPPTIDSFTDDTGADPADGTTNDATPTFTGTGEEGALVEITLDDGAGGTVTGTATVTGGSWSFTPPADLADGTWTATAIQTDIAGNVSAPSTPPFPVTVDTTIIPPTIDSFSDDTGVDPADGITNDATPTFTGTGEEGAVVEITLNDDAGGTVTGTATVTGGTWTFTPPADLADGTWTATAIQTDIAGNVSGPSTPPFPVTVDTTIIPPTIDSFSDDAGVDPADGITNDATPTFTGTGEEGAVVEITLDDGAGGTVTGTATVTGGSWSFTPPADLADGTWTATAIQTDIAGNVSGPSNSLPVTVDTTIIPPTIDSFNDDTGADPADGITNDATPTFTGTGEDGALVEITLDDGAGGTITGTATVTGGSWTFTPPADLADGTWTATAIQTDIAGNVSVPSNSFPVTVDTVVAPPTIDSFTDDTGADPADGITNDATPTFTGTGEDGALVEITLDDGAGGTITGTATVAGGSWSFTPPADLADGTWTATAIQTDIAGNVSTVSNSLPVTVDTVVAPPTIDSFSDDTGVQGDFITSDDTPSFAGTCEDGATVVLTLTRYDELGNAVENFSDVAITTGTSWEFENFTAMADGRWEVVAAQTDIAGNTSANSTPFEVTVDTTTPFLTLEAMSNDYEVADDYVTHAQDFQLSGQADPGAIVEFFLDGAPLSSVAADASGFWESDVIDISSLTGGMTADITARITGINGLYSEEARTISIVDRVDDLGLIHDAQFVGQNADDLVGRYLSNIGDFNGDGIDDFVLSGYGNDAVGQNAGAIYVIYGKEGERLDGLNLGALTVDQGFRVRAESEYDYLGFSISGSGDLNGDGLADLLVGAHRYGTANSEAGRAYVIYGKAGHTNFNISSMPATDGYTLTNSGFNQTGSSVSSAGDVNGDGIDDMLLGATKNAGGGANAGAAYLVFGKAGTSSNIALNTLSPADGIRITGDLAGDTLGESVSILGDVNGDGFNDFLIGAVGQDPNGTASGAAYIVYGKSTGWADIDLSSFSASDGFKVSGLAAGDRLGASVSSAGDFNGDGIEDFLIGAPGTDHNGTDTGSAYVIFGGAGLSSIDLSTLTPAQGTEIRGVLAEGELGAVVSSAGDVDGDGLDDIIVSVPDSDEKGSGTGSAYIIYGKSGGLGTVDVTDLSTQDGFKVVGRASGSKTGHAGKSVTAAGDVNGDGFDDLLLGAPRPSGTPGTAHLIYGTSRTSQWMVLEGTNADDWITGGASSDKITGGGGADTLLGYGGDDHFIVADTAFKRIDGGEGEDTLILSGGGIHIDMTALDEFSILGIDVVDLTGSGNNELTITEQDVLDMSDNGLLRIDGNTGDQVHAAGFTDTGSDQVVGDSTYDVYTSGSATLWVEQQTLIS
ncbi:Ig-like domain repeat protein [Nitratireductor basaltis]|uniref:Iron-regulated protein FrpC n=1 Tax=Nitratireductor basaltis TaxID=472175 RepID=A0A084UD78_9HYPH|nr:Ig-like domain repeat protein [Nitratireductor basaltis]KFB10914.1 Iron-regulated protein FrpC [Nitratireductor basaltis]